MFFIDFINANKLEQDHPCVLEMIRRHFLHEPSPPEIPYNLDNPAANLGSDDLESNNNVSITAPYIIGLLKNQVGELFKCAFYKLISIFQKQNI